MARKDGQLNFASLSVGDRFRFKGQPTELVYTKMSGRYAFEADAPAGSQQFKCSLNKLVERA
ncbi:hypothetical protein [Pseudomonas aeruginosa]|uniref:hypothetical protein n=1 Tax=Pseudomonas aeruginosa TaxID=287 RepID=UPI0017DD8AFE|nr:hypothetical protein [Pseudomonas aeruginosa]MDY1270398.1 hypothetical protein [Pseudomonas aeruginosa]